MANPRSLVTGNEMLVPLCEALKIDVSTVQRIVIDCEVNDVVRVYVQQLGRKTLIDFDFQKFLSGDDVEIKGLDE